MDPSAALVPLTGNGLVLREWRDDDLPAMVDLFEDPDVARWTPIPSPFDLAAAHDYLAMIRRTRIEDGRLHLAITRYGDDTPLGLVFISPVRASAGYVVGKAHRGQGLAVRASRLITDFAHQAFGLRRVYLEIASGNVASMAVARSLGYQFTDKEPERVESNGYSLTLLTWVHEV
jgi:RimJ/RimL family protein N-acetyltransferase